MVEIQKSDSCGSAALCSQLQGGPCAPSPDSTPIHNPEDVAHSPCQLPALLPCPESALAVRRGDAEGRTKQEAEDPPSRVRAETQPTLHRTPSRFRAETHPTLHRTPSRFRAETQSTLHRTASRATKTQSILHRTPSRVRPETQPADTQQDLHPEQYCLLVKSAQGILTKTQPVPFTP